MAFLAINLIPLPGLAQTSAQQPTLKIESRDALASEQIDIQINATHVAEWNITAFEMTLVYDKDLLKPVAVTMADAANERGTSKHAVLYHKAVPGKLHVAAAGAQPLGGGEQLLNVTFRVLGGEGVSEITIEDVELFGVTGPVAVLPGKVNIQSELTQNYPNPFSTATTIQYSLKAASMVTLKVYDTLGKLVRTVVDEYQQAGPKSVEIYAKGLASGTYSYQLKTDYFVDTRQMVIVR